MDYNDLPDLTCVYVSPLSKSEQRSIENTYLPSRSVDISLPPSLPGEIHKLCIIAPLQTPYTRTRIKISGTPMGPLILQPNFRLLETGDTAFNGRHGAVSIFSLSLS